MMKHKHGSGQMRTVHNEWHNPTKACMLAKGA